MQDGANRLSAATLTHSDIQNRADYRGSSLGIRGGYSVGNGGMMPIGGSGGSGGSTAGGVGTNQQGQASTGAGKVPGSNLPSNGNWSATPPVVMGASGSGISGGAIRITSLVTGIAAVDNNWLATQQIVQMKKELSNAKTTFGQVKVAGKWA